MNRIDFSDIFNLEQVKSLNPKLMNLADHRSMSESGFDGILKKLNYN